jgi:hypothetical protein
MLVFAAAGLLQERVGRHQATRWGDAWSWSTSQLLMKETDWHHRMYRPWSVLNAQNRVLAAELDYDAYQDYWPDLQFCADGFQAEMERWISSS